MAESRSNYGNTLPHNSSGTVIANEGLVVAAGSIAFATGDMLTTEKKTSALSLVDERARLHPDGKYKLFIDKPVEDTAGDLTVYTYNVCTVDGTNARDCVNSSHTISQSAGVATYECVDVNGLFIGDGTIKLGMKFATDSGAITVYYKLFRY